MKIKKILFCIFLCLLVIKVGTAKFLWLAGAVAIHEAGHIFPLLILKKHPKNLRLNSLGISFEEKWENPVFVWLSGPLLSLVVFALLWTLDVPCLHDFMVFNLSMGVINLIPVYPLDGWNILAKILCNGFGNMNSMRIMRSLGKTLCIMWIALGLGLYFGGKSGILSLLFPFLLCGRLGEMKRFSQKICLMGLLKKDNSIKKIKYIKKQGDYPIIRTMAYMNENYYLTVGVYEGKNHLGSLTENQIITATSYRGCGISLGEALGFTDFLST